MVNTEAYNKIKTLISKKNAIIVAVSKLKPVSDIADLYRIGHKDFGENYVQELVEKQTQLSTDIRWHFLGHLQTNKVKYIAPFIYLIQSVDTEKLLKEIDKQAKKNDRKINILLQVHIADEETKFGFSNTELKSLDFLKYENVQILGLMGMATFTNDNEKIKEEFLMLKNIFENIKIEKQIELSILSMGMSGDYELAMDFGSNMIRIGSLLFGER